MKHRFSFKTRLRMRVIAILCASQATRFPEQWDEAVAWWQLADKRMRRKHGA